MFPDTGWHFTTLYGLAYGLESAVVAFNRFPQLGIAITRRCLVGCCAACFDDELSVEFLQRSVCLVLAFTVYIWEIQLPSSFKFLRTEDWVFG